MPEQTLSPDAATDRSTAPLMTVPRAAAYFAVVYLSQGICQSVTLLNQPLRMYLEKGAGFDAERVSNFRFAVMIPWMIKPLYGLMSDFVPLFGYRRKSYLLLVNLLASAAFFLLTGVDSPHAVKWLLILTAVGVAVSDVVVDAMMVQTGQATGRTRLFQGVQWFAISAAAILAGLLGSAICDRWASQPATALHVASGIAAAVPLVVVVMTWFLVVDRRVPVDLGQFAATGKALLGAFASPTIWLVVAFLFLVQFNPGTQQAMYTHLDRAHHLPHSYAAILDAWYSVGGVAGALVFTLVLATRCSTKTATAIGLIVGALGLLPLMFATGRVSGAVAYAIWGATNMVAILSQLSIAAEACPKRVEAAVFAALMSVLNLSMQYSDVLGSKLYESGPMKGEIWPLIVLSAALTAAGLLLLPFIKPAPPEPQSGPEPDSETLHTGATTL